jgi:5-methylthioadenosine/S-adenosylhomocysteine deaminase
MTTPSLMPAPRPFVLQGATVACEGSHWQPRRGIDLLVADGVLREIDARALPPADRSVLDIVDARALLLVPGFINGHTHSPEALGRGRATDATLDDWLPHAYEGLDALGPEGLTRAITLAAGEMIASGTVAVTDHLRQRPQSSATIVAAARAWQRTGLQARVAINLRDQDLPADVAQSAAELLAMAREALDTLGPHTIGLGPSAPQRCGDALLQAMAALARERGSFLHTHVNETRANAADCEARYGRSTIAHLDRLGYLGPTTELIHCVHVSDDDWRRLADTGTRFVHCPLANMRLGSGIAATMKAHRAGVDVRLATDGAGSNDAQSMLEVVKMSCLLSRLRPEANEWVSPERALSMATGRASLGTGQPAHLLAFDLNAACFADARDEELVARLVLAAGEPAIALRVVGGRRLPVPPAR